MNLQSCQVRGFLPSYMQCRKKDLGFECLDFEAIHCFARFQNCCQCLHILEIFFCFPNACLGFCFLQLLRNFTNLFSPWVFFLNHLNNCLGSKIGVYNLPLYINVSIYSICMCIVVKLRGLLGLGRLFKFPSAS